MKISIATLRTSALLASILLSLVPHSYSQQAQSLDQLLKLVEQGKVSEARENRQREQRFLADKNRQQGLLVEAKKIRKQEEQRSLRLEKSFEKNELVLQDKQEQLKQRMGALTELFGHLTATAGDLRSVFDNSLISAQYPNREGFLDQLIEKMNGAEKLPRIDEIEQLWFEMQREMIESGRVVRFDAEVTKPGGDKLTGPVLRVGSFNIVSEQGHYLSLNDNGVLEELARQPRRQYLDWGEVLAASSQGFSAFGVDPTGPSGGSYLSALIDSPTLKERFDQGGTIGLAIACLGGFAFALAIWRLLVLVQVNGKVKAQLKSSENRADNPLGRVLKVHDDNPSMDTETLELKLSEAVLKEIPRINFGLNLLKIISAVAPLMGLLGTVTGMIITFQAITIFGAGDPKAMAGGISGALVTTVLGLLVAIPTVLLHTLCNGQASKVIHILEEQSTGIIAEHTEGQAE
jgi:biopolymer transport protein ExbB